jgi:putative transposase
VSAPVPSELPSYRGYRYPAEIIGHAVWLYFRFSLSLRDVEELLAERGVTVTYETIRAWCSKFGPNYAAGLRRRRASVSDKWHLDEVQLKIKGKRHWLWRAVDKHGVVLDILIQPRRDQCAAETFLRRVLAAAGSEPRVVITDKLASYRVLRFTMTSRCESGQRRYQGTFVVARRRSGRPGRRSAGSSPLWEGATHRSAALSEACRVARIDPQGTNREPSLVA